MDDTVDLRALQQRYFPRERLEWAARPIPRFFAPGILPSFLFAIPWTAFALFWMAGASGFRWPFREGFTPVSLFPLFGLPFVLIGLFLLSAPLRNWLRMRRQVYVITHRRAIVVGRRSARSWPRRDLNSERVDRANGTGALLLSVDVVGGLHGSNSYVPVGFVNLPQAELSAAEEALERLLARDENRRDAPFP